MNLARLHNKLHLQVVALKNKETHEGLPRLCLRLGLPAPDFEGTKGERLAASFDALVSTDLPEMAQRFLEHYPPTAVVRNEIQDILWADRGGPNIPRRFRRELARSLDIHELYLDCERFSAFLDRLWILDDDPWAFVNSNQSLRSAVDRHVFRNPGDWTVEELWDKLGAFAAPDGRFALFLEGLASSDVLPDEGAQRRFVAIVNNKLRGCGIEVRETDSEGGYPVFTRQLH